MFEKLYKSIEWINVDENIMSAQLNTGYFFCKTHNKIEKFIDSNVPVGCYILKPVYWKYVNAPVAQYQGWQFTFPIEFLNDFKNNYNSSYIEIVFITETFFKVECQFSIHDFDKDKVENEFISIKNWFENKNSQKNNVTKTFKTSHEIQSLSWDKIPVNDFFAKLEFIDKMNAPYSEKRKLYEEGLKILKAKSEGMNYAIEMLVNKLIGEKRRQK